MTRLPSDAQLLTPYVFAVTSLSNLIALQQLVVELARKIEQLFPCSHNNKSSTLLSRQESKFAITSHRHWRGRLCIFMGVATLASSRWLLYYLLEDFVHDVGGCQVSSSVRDEDRSDHTFRSPRVCLHVFWTSQRFINKAINELSIPLSSKTEHLEHLRLKDYEHSLIILSIAPTSALIEVQLYTHSQSRPTLKNSDVS